MKYYAVEVNERGYGEKPYINRTLFKSFERAMEFCYTRARLSWHLESFYPDNIREGNDGLILFNNEEIEAWYRIIEMFTE